MISPTPAGEDVQPVNGVIAQLHCIESCRSVLEVLAMSSYVLWLLLLFGAIFPQDAHLILAQQQVAISS